MSAWPARDNMKKVLRFTASWCAPCKALAPIVESTKGDCQVDVIDIDTEDGTALATKYGIRGVPTLVMIEDDKEVKRRTGMANESVISNWFNS